MKGSRQFTPREHGLQRTASIALTIGLVAVASQLVTALPLAFIPMLW
jgi:hypothetical protein